jgi:hypothetical protein
LFLCIVPFEEVQRLPTPNELKIIFQKKQPMLTVQNYTSKKNRTRQRNTLQGNNPKPFSDSSIMKKNTSTKNFLKRLSPFLVTAILFPLLVFYTTIKSIHFYEYMLWQVFIFSFLELNIILFDFILWNYFEGKKIARIWVIELTCESALIYFFL